MGTEMIAHSQHMTKVDDYIRKFELKQKYRGLFKSIAILNEKSAFKMPMRTTSTLLVNDEKVESKPLKMSDAMNAKQKYVKTEKLWKESKIHSIPPMPDEADEEKAITGCDYKCAFCGDLCDVENLRCKTCANVFHIECLHHRGHLHSVDISARDEWSCSDCNDLSKLLNEEEMLKLISLFDELDLNKDCIVNCNEYIRLKKKLLEEYGQAMTLKEEDAERRHFRLMDTDNSGSITWNEFINYEAPNLLAKKNKVELSNHLSLRELILIKRKFLSFDKLKMDMISKEDAKTVYIEYIQKLRKKLGRAFEEHLSACDKLLGLSNNEKLNENHKVTWEEFVRKMTILIIFDRLNSQGYAPQSWKPGNWFKSSFDRENTLFRRQKTLTFFKNLHPRASLVAAAKKKKLFKINSNKFIEMDYLMKNDFKSENYKPFDDNEFGSEFYVIRSTYEKTYNDGKPMNSAAKVSASQRLAPIEFPPNESVKATGNRTETVNTDVTKNTPSTVKQSQQTAKTVQIRSESPVTIQSVTTMSNFTDKTKPPHYLKARELPPIESNSPAHATIPQKPHTVQKTHLYEDLIKKIHENKRFVQTTNISSKYRKSSFNTSNQMMIKKHATVIPTFDFDQSSASFRNSHVNFENSSTINTNTKTRQFARLSELHGGKLLPDINSFNSRSSFVTALSKPTSTMTRSNNITQSLDTFYKKNSNKRQKHYLKSNHIIWSNILNHTNQRQERNTSYFNNESKLSFQSKALQSSLVF